MTIYCIGIDPDLDASGVAVAEGGKIKSLECLTFHDLSVFLSNNKDQIKKVYLEAGWLNQKANFHKASGANVREQMAYRVGINHCVGMMIEKELKEQGIDYVLIKPWETKRNHEQFCKYTGWAGGRTNQETRDAACLVFGHK